MEPDSRSGKKKMRFAGYFVFVINGFGCGYARFEDAGVAFSEHQKSEKNEAMLLYEPVYAKVHGSVSARP